MLMMTGQCEICDNTIKYPHGLLSASHPHPDSRVFSQPPTLPLPFVVVHRLVSLSQLKLSFAKILKSTSERNPKEFFLGHPGQRCGAVVGVSVGGQSVLGGLLPLV